MTAATISARTTIRVPLVTSVVGLLAVVAAVGPLPSWLEFDRTLIATGQVWRILTGHLVHWNADHLLWDLFALLTLGAFCELRNRRQFIACLAASTLAISLVLLCFASKVVHYRGLSGLDSALYVLAVGSLCGEAWKNRGYLGTAIFAAGLLGLAGKLAYEMTTGQTLFVDAESAGFVPLPLVHAIGGVVGLAILVFAGFASRAGSASWVAHRRANQRSASPLSI